MVPRKAWHHDGCGEDVREGTCEVLKDARAKLRKGQICSSGLPKSGMKEPVCLRPGAAFGRGLTAPAFTDGNLYVKISSRGLLILIETGGFNEFKTR